MIEIPYFTLLEEDIEKLANNKDLEIHGKNLEPEMEKGYNLFKLVLADWKERKKVIIPTTCSLVLASHCILDSSARQYLDSLLRISLILTISSIIKIKLIKPQFEHKKHMLLLLETLKKYGITTTIKELEQIEYLSYYYTKKVIRDNFVDDIEKLDILNVHKKTEYYFCIPSEEKDYFIKQMYINGQISSLYLLENDDLLSVPEDVLRLAREK